VAFGGYSGGKEGGAAIKVFSGVADFELLPRLLRRGQGAEKEKGLRRATLSRCSRRKGRREGRSVDCQQCWEKEEKKKKKKDLALQL